MENQIPTPEMSQAALMTIQNIFFDKIALLDKGEDLKKQELIYEVLGEIIKFINSSPYSFFEIVLLQPNCEDIENVDYGVVVKNFPHFVLDIRKPYTFRIIINQTWNGFKIYQKDLHDRIWLNCGNGKQG